MTQRRLLTVAGLGVLLALASSCTRSDVGVPSPAGPSTLSITFDLEATPNVILATEERPMTTIKATVRKNGAALPNVPVYFTIVAGPGEFSDYSTRVSTATDSTGVASILYIGPTKFELTRDTTVTIQGQMQSNSPDFIYKTVEVRILRAAD
jgi:hypothetical protein